MSNAIVGAAFWIFIAAVVVAGIWYAYARNRETQKTIRAAIDKGTPLDDALVEKLLARDSGRPSDYYTGGIVCLACAIGLPILGYFVEKVGPGSFYPIAGAGILVGLVGIGLILSGMLIGRRNRNVNNTGRGM